MHYQVVVFDLFHTIVDPEDFRPREFRRAERVAALLGIHAPAFSAYWSHTLSIRNTNRSMTVVKLVEEFLTRNKLAYDTSSLREVDHELGRFQDMALLQPRPEVVSVLRTLSNSGLKLGLLTNCDEREVREWPNSPISAFFDTACFSCDIGVEKPALRAYQLVLEKMGRRSKEAVYVGDGGNNELEGAKRAGFALTVLMEGFVAKNGLRKEKEIQALRQVADVSIDRLDDLIPLLGLRHVSQD